MSLFSSPVKDPPGDKYGAPLVTQEPEFVLVEPELVTVEPDLVLVEPESRQVVLSSSVGCSWISDPPAPVPLPWFLADENPTRSDKQDASAGSSKADLGQTTSMARLRAAEGLAALQKTYIQFQKSGDAFARVEEPEVVLLEDEEPEEPQPMQEEVVEQTEQPDLEVVEINYKESVHLETRMPGPLLFVNDDKSGACIVHIDIYGRKWQTTQVLAGVGVFFAFWHPCNVSRALDSRVEWNVDDAVVVAAILACQRARAAGLHKLRICSSNKKLKGLVKRHQRRTAPIGIQTHLSHSMRIAILGLQIEWTVVSAIAAGQCCAFKLAFQGARDQVGPIWMTANQQVIC
ncbi:Hypothetical predicted protein [Cloeon dipterum]|uniref:Uncharacterized protein n=1 Tax=Cloeon dipterum TaxID=197152 RepID=A0A8S1EEY9_9INSE|nr:Hypothetical predicted protein [Cloeon dipterum]